MEKFYFEDLNHFAQDAIADLIISIIENKKRNPKPLVEKRKRSKKYIIYVNGILLME